MENRGALMAEFLGVFALCFVGAAAIMHDIGLVGIALAHGLILAMMIAAMGHISGGHFNPAVTIAALATRRIGAGLAFGYIVAQLAGGAVAGFLLKTIFPAQAVFAANLGTPTVAAGVGVGQAILVEVILTFFLVTTIWGTAMDKRGPGNLAPFAIGLVIAADILAGGPITGAAMNPARTFGTALAGGFWGLHWVYWVGPVLGGLIAAFLYDRVTAR